MKTNYVLIDYENVQVKSLALLNGDHFRVHVFLGKNNTKLHSELAIAMQALGDRGQYVRLESSGANALDFHIAYYLGRLAVSDPTGHFHIISKDTGFDPLIEHLKAQRVTASRSASIQQMPCFPQPSALPVLTTPIQTEISTPPPKANLAAKLPLTEVEMRVKVAVADLIAHKSKCPAKMKTLLNSIHNRIGMERPIAEAMAVRDMLVAREYVSVNGLKVTYNLP